MQDNLRNKKQGATERIARVLSVLAWVVALLIVAGTLFFVAGFTDRCSPGPSQTSRST